MFFIDKALEAQHNLINKFKTLFDYEITFFKIVSFGFSRLCCDLYKNVFINEFF